MDLSIIDCIRNVQSSEGKWISVIINTIVYEVRSIGESVNVGSENKSCTRICLINQSSWAFLSRNGGVSPSYQDSPEGNCSKRAISTNSNIERIIELRDWGCQVGIRDSENACCLIERALRSQSRRAGNIELVFISSNSRR